jgi:hypothetical protein
MWKPWQYRHVDGRRIINTGEKEEGIKKKWLTGRMRWKIRKKRMNNRRCYMQVIPRKWRVEKGTTNWA